jgi:hypothetical protein
LLKYSAHTSYCWSQSLVDRRSQAFEIWWSHNTKSYNSYFFFLWFCIGLSVLRNKTIQTIKK